MASFRGANSRPYEATFMCGPPSLSQGDPMNAVLEVLGISVQEFARLLRVSVSQVYRIGGSDETFPKPRKIDRATRYDRREVRAWFDAQRVDVRAVRHAARRKRLRSLRVARSRAGDAASDGVAVSPVPRSGFPAAKRLPLARSAFPARSAFRGRPTGDFPRVPRGRAVSAVDCIRGNTHFPFADLNNVQIADLMAGFLARKGLD